MFLRTFGFLCKSAAQEREDGGLFRFQISHIAAQLDLGFCFELKRLPSM